MANLLDELNVRFTMSEGFVPIQFPIGGLAKPVLQSNVYLASCWKVLTTCTEMTLSTGRVGQFLV
jgi:hypothetical protein